MFIDIFNFPKTSCSRSATYFLRDQFLLNNYIKLVDLRLLVGKYVIYSKNQFQFTCSYLNLVVLSTCSYQINRQRSGYSSGIIRIPCTSALVKHSLHYPRWYPTPVKRPFEQMPVLVRNRATVDRVLNRFDTVTNSVPLSETNTGSVTSTSGQFSQSKHSTTCCRSWSKRSVRVCSNNFLSHLHCFQCVVNSYWSTWQQS